MTQQAADTENDRNLAAAHTHTAKETHWDETIAKPRGGALIDANKKTKTKKKKKGTSSATGNDRKRQFEYFSGWINL